MEETSPQRQQDLQAQQQQEEIKEQNTGSTNYLSTGRYAPHLSEFYSIFNNRNQVPSISLDNTSITTEHFQNAYSRRPSSIRSTTSTISDLQTLVTKRDMQNTSAAIIDLWKSSAAYSKSLKKNAKNSSRVATSIETLAKLKGCNDETAKKLLNASGLFHLLSNHEQIMSNTLEVLINNNIDVILHDFEQNSKSLQNQFKKNCKEQSNKLKLQEKYNTQLAKRKVRNIISYRESLTNLQIQLDQLEQLRHDFYQDSYLLVDSTCNQLLKDVASLSRAQVEICENIARKGWSGGGLDDLLLDADDPFSKDEEDDEEEDEEGNNNNNTNRNFDADDPYRTPRLEYEAQQREQQQELLKQQLHSPMISPQQDQQNTHSEMNSTLDKNLTPINKSSPVNNYSSKSYTSTNGNSPIIRTNSDTEQDNYYSKTSGSVKLAPTFRDLDTPIYEEEHSFSLPKANSVKSNDEPNFDNVNILPHDILITTDTSNVVDPQVNKDDAIAEQIPQNGINDIIESLRDTHI
ncbi:hypothetical protein TBLA_0I02650 [Henningerozyma blattae CBS 6284]|uniref:IMD domain-containing protein n=1 Tax=Henningerozyma blattae (strain ATCC 34711 / CBS 6284 / DSM 70876 / NBRC 10599 / NRRL Y-10934 / UCD 77-7) TaxID=1071380 RepID=I2H969_HENB6|nr:hypothetical protein TBLA_0I02650 [Tetrapisispora blattae CBS 6284]CCH62921.1 hypothetical protein TBLA_0I02650 [Tetrapisispora blattae CBS 6284]